MYFYSLVASVLAFAAGFASTKTRRSVSVSDLIIPVAFAGLTAWAVAIHVSGVLYSGASAAYVSSTLIDILTSSESIRARRIGKASQSAIPLALFVAVWLTKPPYFEVGVAFTGAIWIKHLLFDQIGLRK